MALPAYHKISFEDATRIIYFNFSRNSSMFKELMEDLMTNSLEPANCIAPRWYDAYKNHLSENKKDK